MEKKDKQRVEAVIKEAESAAEEMSALLHNVESSTVEATRILNQLKVSAGDKVKEYIDGRRSLNEDEKSKQGKINKALEKTFGGTEEAKKSIESSEKVIKKMHLNEFSGERRRKIVI